jgi:L-threonylcarbamoyladenylate synthase
MATEVLRMLDRGAQSDEFDRAGAILRAGGLVAFPTETVYGIAVAAHLPDAVERLYELKTRDRTKPMTMMVATMDPVRERCPKIPAKAMQLMRRFWPGSLTLVMPTQHDDGSDAGLIGFRYPAHPLAQGLVKAAGVPLLVPSANLSGKAPATTAEEVLAQFPDQLDLVIDGGPAEKGLSSTVVKVDGEDVSVLREGAIPEWRINEPHWSHILFVCTGNTDRSPLAAALLSRHLASALGCTEDELEDRGFKISSAGLAAESGQPASRRVRQIARDGFEPPIDLTAHRSQRLTQELLDKTTRIVCMERAQRDEILAFFPHRVREVMLLDPEGGDIDDPAGQGMDTYRRMAKRLDAAGSLIASSFRA